jgi:hypothetical protein
MDQLPQELVDRISSYLSPADLKNTLLLSHTFRFPAEKYSGAFAIFALNRDTAEKFIATFSGHRLLYLRDLEFVTSLPPPENSGRRDSTVQLSKHDKSFTQQIKFLFNTMKTVEERAKNQNKLGTVRLAISTPWQLIPSQQSLSYHNHLSWRVHLLEPQALPLLRSIRSLEIGDDGGGSFYRRAADAGFKWRQVKLDYRMMVDLVVKLPNIEYWGCRIGGDEWSRKTEQEASRYFKQDWAGPRRDSRQDFAKALLTASLPDSLQRIRLDFLHDLQFSTYIDHLTPQPDMVSPAANDLFSTSLHHLSHHLRRLHLRVVADETLFWPKDNCTPFWPKLESLIVMFHMVSPLGQWYFIGPNGEGRHTASVEITDASYPPLETTPYDEEMDAQITWNGYREDTNISNTRIRIAPNDTTIRPFLSAFAKASSNMRALQEAMLWCPLVWDPNDEDGGETETDWLSENCPGPRTLGWGIHYQAPGECDCTIQGGQLRLRTKVPQLWWKVGKWRPDPELHELFQQIGRTPWGDGLEESWDDECSGQGLVDREYFEYCVQEEVDKVGWILPRN